MNMPFSYRFDISIIDISTDIELISILRCFAICEQEFSCRIGVRGLNFLLKKFNQPLRQNCSKMNVIIRVTVHRSRTLIAISPSAWMRNYIIIIWIVNGYMIYPMVCVIYLSHNEDLIKSMKIQFKYLSVSSRIVLIVLQCMLVSLTAMEVIIMSLRSKLFPNKTEVSVCNHW